MTDRAIVLTAAPARIGFHLCGVGLAPDAETWRADVLNAVADRRDVWLVLGPIGARLSGRAGEVLRVHANERPDVDLFYADDVAVGENAADDLRLKPSFNPALLVSQDYIGAPVFVRGAALHHLGGLRTEPRSATLYDLVLRAHAEGFAIERVDEVLLAHPGRRPQPDPGDRRRALEDAIGGLDDEVEVLSGAKPGLLRVRRRFPVHPDVTLVVPTRQSSAPAGDRPCILELLESLPRSTWPMSRLTVLVGDDVVSPAAYAGRDWPFRLIRIQTLRGPDEPFNYAAKMNRLWRAAETEHLVLMNDDITVAAPDWLEALMTFAVRADVGGVGGRLLYPDGTVQHAGVVGGLFDGCVHPWIGLPASAPTYQDWALSQRDWSMVSGALFATRKSVLKQVNGFDERFSLEFNDLDLALRLRILGRRIVYAPDAEMVHHERVSRGRMSVPASQVALFFKRWGDVIRDDPAYHPGMSRDSFAPYPAADMMRWWA